MSTALLAGFDLATPLVCAVNGHAFGGGIGLVRTQAKDPARVERRADALEIARIADHDHRNSFVRSTREHRLPLPAAGMTPGWRSR